MPPIDPQMLMGLLMHLLTQAPPAYGTEIAGGGTPEGPPAFAKTPDPQQAQLLQLFQTLKMMPEANAQNMANGLQGFQGGAFGHMGGRPPGS